ncbi:right-handed parallel beta-helix repeat-containing protein, partial [Rhodoplanes sp. SY1]|uniref:right-handed parallel beta-helix repeat-containing protein n=1 Tax=Rhodoplanes sp. SY1 TaxID=3166646 RepID=UPI0038B47FC7
DAGDEAVWVVGGSRSDLAPAEHRIEHNVMTRFGRRTRGGHGAIYLDGVGNRVEANVIRDGPAQAIHFQGNDHVISRNDISGVVSECGDCGAIYTGMDWTARGTCLEGNVVHDVTPASGRPVVAIYIDDAASGVTARRNVIRGFRRGILVGGGRDNTITDNTIVGADVFGILLDARGVTWAARHVADPASPIRRNLATVPIDKEPWRSRYPHLVDILSDEPGLPKYNRISGNAFAGGPGLVLSDPSLKRLLLGSDQVESAAVTAA